MTTSVIIPTRNEGENFVELVSRIANAVAPVSTTPGAESQSRTTVPDDYEIIIVDDASTDGTEAICADLSRRYPLRLITRVVATNGLSGAVLHGMAAATGDLLVVMDGDLQHPPEKIPQLLQPLIDGTADFVLGSRYAPGGSIESGWSPYRRINSTVATLLARPFIHPSAQPSAHPSARPVTDPMSGMFALRRTSVLEARRLSPLGYKIGLELLCKTGARRTVEVPIHFAGRRAGQSKLTLREQFRYLEHLSRLYDYTFPRAAPALKFLIVTLIGAGIAFCCYLILRSVGVPVFGSITLSYLSVLLTTAVFHARYVRTQREFLHRPNPWRDFVLTGLVEWVIVTIATGYYVSRSGLPAVHILLLSYSAGLFTRYVLRKELQLDLRGLRYEIRKDEMRSDTTPPVCDSFSTGVDRI